MASIFLRQSGEGPDLVPPLVEDGISRGEETVAVGMASGSLSEIIRYGGSLGAEFYRTLGRYGMEIERAPSNYGGGNVVISGDVHDHAGNRIGKSDYYFPTNMSLMYMLGTHILPRYADDAAGHNSVHMFYGREQDDFVRVNGVPLGVYETRDIGGMEIDRHGREAYDTIYHQFRLPWSTLNSLYTIAAARSIPVRDVAREGFRLIGDEKDSLEVPFGALESEPTEDSYTYASFRIPRTSCQKTEKIARILETPIDTIFGATLARYADEQENDPALHDKIAAVIAEWDRPLPRTQ